jgi:hypothetical protein
MKAVMKRRIARLEAIHPVAGPRFYLVEAHCSKTWDEVQADLGIECHGGPTFWMWIPSFDNADRDQPARLISD